MKKFYFTLKSNNSLHHFEETSFVMAKNYYDAISSFAGLNGLRVLDKEEPLNAEFESIKHGGIITFKVQ